MRGATAHVSRLLTASSLQRYAICSASAVLPQVQSVSEAATRGTWLHRFAEEVPKLGREEALANVPDEYRAAAECIEVAALPLDAMRYAQEVTFAYDVVTGVAREVGRGLTREQAYANLAPAEIGGTADVVGISEDGLTVIIFDFKFGHSPIAKAAANWQIRFLVMAAARAYGAIQGRGALIHVKTNGLPFYDAAAFDAFEVALIAHETAGLYERAARAEQAHRAGEVPPCTTGEHCRYCPSLAYCPAQTSLVRTVVGELEAGDLDRPLTVATAAEAWQRVKAIEAWAKRAKAVLVTYAAGNPIPLPGGLVLGSVTEAANERVDGATARAVLLDLEGGAEGAIYFASWVTGSDPTPALDALAGWAFADQACEFSTSKTAIEKALRPVAQSLGLTFAAVNRAALGAVRAAGAMSRPTVTTVKEHVPSERAAIEVAELLAS